MKRSLRSFRNSVYFFIFFPLASLHHALQLLIRYWLTRVIMTRIWHHQHFNTLLHYIFLRFFSALDRLIQLLSDDIILDFLFIVITLGDTRNSSPSSIPLLLVCLHWVACSTNLPSHCPHTGPYLPWLTLYQARDLTISVAQFLATISFYTRLVIIYSSVSYSTLRFVWNTVLPKRLVGLLSGASVTCFLVADGHFLHKCLDSFTRAGQMSR